jgi:outer membrane protein OmpA-like peptidoglycan-associated protein
MTRLLRFTLLAWTAGGLLPATAVAADIVPLIWDDCPGFSDRASAAEKVRVPLVSPYAVNEMMKRGDDIELLDVRSPEDFAKDHLAGARNFTSGWAAAAQMPWDRTYVLYCSICCCPEIPIAARALLEQGNKKVRVLRAGLEETGDLIVWRSPASGLPDPDNLIRLPCGQARTAVKQLTDKILNDDIPPIEFEFDSAVLRGHSKETLDAIANALSDHASVKLKVHGHTCTTGATHYNLRLSGRRAAAVRRYLIRSGVRSDAILSNGFGESQPVAPNDSEAGRRLNRRVELLWHMGDK